MVHQLVAWSAEFVTILNAARDVLVALGLVLAALVHDLKLLIVILLSIGTIMGIYRKLRGAKGTSDRHVARRDNDHLTGS